MAPTRARPNPNMKDDTGTLLSLVSTSQDLLAQYLAALSRSAPSTSEFPLQSTSRNETQSTVLAPSDTEPVSTTTVNPLHIIRDAAKLLKAHTTKISLLLLNKPFTPSAICLQLREMMHTCLPALMSAAEMCAKVESRGRLVRTEVVAGVRRVLREMGVCLREVRDMVSGQDEGIAPGSIGAKSGETGIEGGTYSSGGHRTRDTLAFTGVLWEACDSLIEIETLGVAGLALRKAQQYHDQLRDAITELKEWGEDDGEDGEDGAVHDDKIDDDDGYENDSDDDDTDDDMFTASDKLPKGQPELKEKLAQALDQLKKTDFLFTAIQKRRIKPFDASHEGQTDSVKVLDSTLDRLKTLAESVDDLASAFYELDEEDVDVQIRACAITARAILDDLRLDWHGREDEFTSWADKWKELVRV